MWRERRVGRLRLSGECRQVYRDAQGTGSEAVRNNLAMGPESRPLRRSDVLAQAAGETIILLTPESGEYYTLNEVGGRIWELADGSRSVAEIAAVLVDEY